MRRIFVLVLALCALLWHVVAGVSLRAGSDMAASAEHAGMHWTETQHHHDDDGRVALDDSSASMAHLAMDGSAPTILRFERLEVPPFPLTHGQPAYAVVPLTAPFLAPLQRPPQRLA